MWTFEGWNVGSIKRYGIIWWRGGKSRLAVIFYVVLYKRREHVRSINQSDGPSHRTVRRYLKFVQKYIYLYIYISRPHHRHSPQAHKTPIPTLLHVPLFIEQLVLFRLCLRALPISSWSLEPTCRCNKIWAPNVTDIPTRRHFFPSLIYGFRYGVLL